MVSAIVLAAGLSSRMGNANKLLLPYKNKPVIFNVVETIIKSGIPDVIVITGHEAKEVQDALEDLPVRMVHNPRYPEGMTSSIQQGVSAAMGDGYMICLSDMMLITEGEYRYICEVFARTLVHDPQCICVPRYNQEKGNPVIFSATYKSAILDNIEPEGCRNIVQNNREHLHFLEMTTPHILQDFDNPAEYKNLPFQL
jgi:molybdenum cofactor cytidylyltransferase